MSRHRPKAEHHRSIDIRRMARNGWLRPGSYSYSWSSSDGQPMGSIGFTSAPHLIALQFSIDGAPFGQRVSIVRTPCHLGGNRPWFLCPRCPARVAVLYLRGSVFACRKCHRLGYMSQALDATGRAWRKQSKLERLLGPDGLKPKGMHWKTCDALIERIDECDAIRDAQLLVALQRLRITLVEAMCG